MTNEFNLNQFLRSKFFKFLYTGGINTLFGYSVYAGLLYIRTPYLLSLFISTVAGVIFNYFSFSTMVFRGKSDWVVFARFIFSYAVIYAVNAILLSVLTVQFHVSPYLGQAVCIPVSVALSWLMMNFWVYKKD